MKNQSKIYLGDSQDILPTFKPESIDLMATDAPYGLSFMGKDWDKAVPSVEIWKACFRVLKPGAFGFIMCIPRQDCLAHMIVNLGDAGFNVNFSSIYWTYACLSEDTEILTKEGWVRWHIAKSLYTPILIYNYREDVYRWEIPAKWQHYQIKDTCYRIKSNFTDQLVTRGHRVAIEQEGKILFRFAEKIRQKERLPYLDSLRRVQKDISFIASTDPSSNEARRRSEILQSGMQWKRKGTSTECVQQRTQNGWAELDRREKANSTPINDGRKKQGMEGRSNLFQNAWQLLKRKICTLPGSVFKYGSQRWICNGASLISSARIGKAFMAIRNSTPYRSRSNKQQSRQFNAISRQSRPQTIRRRKSYNTALATITEEDYEGVVFCPTVSTGCFVARRNGKIFITGNSGFPKAQNLSKVADRRAGVKREVIGKKQYASSAGNNDNFGTGKQKTNIHKREITVPVTPAAKALEGAYGGFQPKPAVEIVIVVMKPIREKTYLDQALKNHHGCTWLDDCRIPYESESDEEHHLKSWTSQRKNQSDSLYKLGIAEQYSKGQEEFAPQNGRFLANLVCEDDVLNNGRALKPSARPNIKGKIYQASQPFNFYGKTTEVSGYPDEGSFSRYFSLDTWFSERIKRLPKEVQKTFPWLIIPKPSKSEKNKHVDTDFTDNSDIYNGKFPDSKADKEDINKHPTIKPVKLMSLLITLGSREGDIVLDPFLGSGTTYIAATALGRYCKGIEIKKEYYDKAVERSNLTQRNISAYF